MTKNVSAIHTKYIYTYIIVISYFYQLILKSTSFFTFYFIWSVFNCQTSLLLQNYSHNLHSKFLIETISCFSIKFSINLEIVSHISYVQRISFVNFFYKNRFKSIHLFRLCLLFLATTGLQFYLKKQN